jgi:hypothetical protein
VQERKDTAREQSVIVVKLKCDISEDLAAGDCAVNEVIVKCVEVGVDCDVDDFISEQCDQSVQ